MRYLPQGAIAIFVCLLAPTSLWTQQLKCTPCNYKFGKVQVSTSSSRFFVLTNTGTKNLRIISTSMQGSAFSIGDFKLPRTVSPGASVQLPVNFTPTDSGRADGVVTITSTDPQSPLTLGVDGFGVPQNSRQLTLSPTSLDFGNVTVGTTSSLPVTLTASDGNVTL